MRFQRIVQRVLPDGKTSTVFPFHVCTEGKENRVVCRDEEDLRVAHNFIPICARRSNVIVFADCELNTHMHSGILAASYQDACKFANSYKQSYSKYFKNRYGNVSGIYIRTDSKPILLEDDNHVRNTVCYIARNSLDAGIPVNHYKWSSYCALFSGQPDPEHSRELKTLSNLEIRNCLKTADNFSDCSWRIDSEGLLIPSSYCDLDYAESAFFHNPKYLLKVLGLTDDQQMEQLLVKNLFETKNVGDLMKLAEEKSIKRYGTGIDSLSVSQKIPIVKSLFYSVRTSPSQLARCLGLEKSKVLWILGKG